MNRTHRTWLLVVTAFVEVGAGLLLLILPAPAFELLLGVRAASAEALVIARVAGAALLALGVASGLERHAPRRGLVVGLLIYNVFVAGVLASAALGLSLAGLALWPAVLLHTLLTGWCIAFLLRKG